MKGTRQTLDDGSRANAPWTGGTSAGLRPIRSLLILGACSLLTGCFGFLKPAKVTTRNFVLTAIPATISNATLSASTGLGVGQVRVPAYLLHTMFAVRRGANEVEYLSTASWAERLDRGFQRVLAANLGTFLPADRVYESAWQRENVSAEVYIVVEQFDVNTNGRGVLVARWRALGQGGQKLLKAGRSELIRDGPAPESDVAGSVSTLSGLVGDLSMQITQVLQEANQREAANSQ